MSYKTSTVNIVGSDLGEGLRLRWSTPDDTEQIATLTGQVFRRSEDEPPNVEMANQMRVVMRGDHPYMTPQDFAVVEDTSKAGRPLVACTCLWQHQWSYAGIPFTAGRPEFVATLPAYRNRGLVRHIFNLIHARSDGRGDLMQGITGIPYFYRQFGYEMVLDLGAHRSAFVALIPELKEGETEPYTLRPATHDDVPLITQLHSASRGDSLLWHEADEAYWRYLIDYWDDPASYHEGQVMVNINTVPYMICDRAGAVVGFVALDHHRWNNMRATELGLAAGTNLHSLMPSLLRAIRDYGTHAPTFRDDAAAGREVVFNLGRHHPLYELMGTAIAPRVDHPYAWYIRMPDVAAFIRHVAPALEERLARSVLTGHNGDVRIDFYRGGLWLHFEQGKLVNVADWRAPAWGERAVAGLPPLIFLQLLLGYRSFDELRAIFPDVWADNDVRLLLDTLFPKQTSRLMPMG